jgi:hypothetical protein
LARWADNIKTEWNGMGGRGLELRRLGTSSELLWTQHWTSWFHKCGGFRHQPINCWVFKKDSALRS